MKKQRVFYTELCYLLGLIVMAFGAAFSERAGFGMSMVVAPAYILHLKISAFLPWFTFGVAEYLVQGLLVLVLALVMRRFKLSYLFSFVTALLYGAALDGAIWVLSFLPHDVMVLRILYFALGTVLCSVAVSLFLHTYISPEAYELIVKEFTKKFSFDVARFKTVYDCISTLVSVALSFAFFGLGVFRGVGVGTVVCALVNGFLIGKISAWLGTTFTFKNRVAIEQYFEM